MSTLGEIIYKYRKEHNLSMEAFSKASGISKAYISILERNARPGTNKPIAPSVETIKLASDGMNMDFNKLFSLLEGDISLDHSDRPLPSNIILPSAHKLPIMGTICAGDGVVCEDDYQGTFIVDIDVKADYCLKVHGDSMIGANIYDGDIVFISKSYDFVQDQIYAIERLDYNEASLKRVTNDGDTLILNPCNPEYHAMVTDYEEVRIIGRCVGVLHKYV